MSRALGLAVLLAALALAAPAPAYPPITCGRTTVAGHAYIVRTHGPKCGFAVKWARAFMARRQSPAGYRCKAYGPDVPAQCLRSGRKSTYFFATRA
jgi:hypothetical protein